VAEALFLDPKPQTLHTRKRSKTTSHTLKPGSQTLNPAPVNGNSRTGGQNWYPVRGHVLCKRCYEHYKFKGTLERAVVVHEAKPPPPKRRTEAQSSSDPMVSAASKRARQIQSPSVSGDAVVVKKKSQQVIPKP
jgi:hypothetical protein